MHLFIKTSMIIFLFLSGVMTMDAKQETNKPKKHAQKYESPSDSVTQTMEALLQDKKDSIKYAEEDLRDSLRELKHDKADSIVDIVEKSSHFEIGTDFSSRVIYAGRTYSKGSVVMSPYITYKHKIGFYGEFMTTHIFPYDSVYHVPVDEIDLSVGFSREVLKNWNVDVSYAHWFLLYGKKNVKVPLGIGKSLEYNTRTELDNFFDVNTSYDFFDYITLEADAGFMFGQPQKTVESGKVISSKREFASQLSLVVMKDFPIYIITKKLNSILSIGPEFETDFGSDNVFKRVNHNADNKKRSSANEVKFWGLLNLESAVNFSWRIKNLELDLGSHLSVPFNLDIHNNKPGSPVFYMEAGVKYLFRYQKNKTEKTIIK